jgi:hypothetical protein
MNIVLWDIENISFVYLKNKLFLFKDFDKFIFVNNKHSPIKEQQMNYLKNLNWTFSFVKPGKNSADSSLIDFINNNINNYSNFHIITGDKDFYKIISFLLNSNKSVFLYLKKDYPSNLVNFIFKNSSNTDLLHISYLD